MHTSRMIVFSDPVAGKEAGYANWYAGRHLRDITDIPGVLSGQFFNAVDSGAGVMRRHMALYEIESGADERILAEIDRRRGTPQMVATDALEKSSVIFLFADPIRPWVGKDGVTAEAARKASCRMLGLGAAVEGQQAEFDRWFDEEHIPDLLGVPGFLGVQRFSVRDRDGKSGWRRVAIYAVASDDPVATLGELRARGPQLRQTNASDRTVATGVMFQAATPRMVSGLAPS